MTFVRAGAVALALALGAAGCAPATGAVVDVMLGASCSDPLPVIVALEAEVVPCVADASLASGYDCTVGAPEDLVKLRQNRFPVTTDELSGPEPVTLLIEDLSGLTARGVTRIRLALSAVDESGAVAAYGAIDIDIEAGVIVQQADPLVVWTACGQPVGTDYDGDGAVGAVDCAPFDATAVGNLPEVCENGIDEDCYLGDAPCTLPMGNPADVDGDGYCAIGGEVRWANEMEILAFCSVNGFTDCDDLDSAVRDVCRCTDLDGDGWCAEPAACANDPATVCNPYGGDCCDGAMGDTGCVPLATPYEVNPGVAEQCDGFDRDCSGSAWDFVASPCYAAAPGGECATGVLCAPPEGAFGCVIPPGAAAADDAALCGGSTGASPLACAECTPVTVWDGTVDAPCRAPAGGVAGTQIVVPAPVTTGYCTWSVIVPSWPLVVTEAPGSDCANGLFDVDLGAIAGPGLFAVYLRYHDVELDADHVVLVLLPVEAGTCAPLTAPAGCDEANGTLCSTW